MICDADEKGVKRQARILNVYHEAGKNKFTQNLGWIGTEIQLS